MLILLMQTHEQRPAVTRVKAAPWRHVVRVD